MVDNDTGYTGRFAPTPSGPLHYGSLVAALASYLDARRNSGRWLVRIDDIDGPRVSPGAADSILQTLETFGLDWDGEVVYQSERGRAYEEALEGLREQGFLYRCDCPRRLIRGRPYPGTCRERRLPAETPRYALRVRTTAAAVGIEDAIQGRYYQQLQNETGDFIVRRSDGIIAYHLANVVDDAWQGVTHVIRGADLLPSTPPQVYLQQLLHLPTPRYAHVPVIVDGRGVKIAKQTGATAVLDSHRPEQALRQALTDLGQAPDPALADAPAEEILAWAIDYWDLSRIPRAMEIQSGD